MKKKENSGNQSLITVLPTGWFSVAEEEEEEEPAFGLRHVVLGTDPFPVFPFLSYSQSAARHLQPPPPPHTPPSHPPSLHIPPDYLARARKQKGDNGQWRNTKGQTQSVSVLDGDEGAAVGRPPSRPPSLHRWRLIPPPHYLYFPNCNERELSITLSA